MNEWKTESTWQSLARTLVAGTVVGGGTLLLFGNDPREAFANGFSFAAMFAAFAWLAARIAGRGRRPRSRPPPRSSVASSAWF
jgi:hypothetical protein